MRNWIWLVLVSFLICLSACGGGGNDAIVLYRDDGVLVVDGREYPRRTPQEIEADAEKYGRALFGVLNVLGKPGVQSEEINLQLRSHGVSSQSIDCELFAAENRCWATLIAVPPDWADQWRRAMADWPWVETIRFAEMAFPQSQ